MHLQSAFEVFKYSCQTTPYMSSETYIPVLPRIPRSKDLFTDINYIIHRLQGNNVKLHNEFVLCYINTWSYPLPKTWISTMFTQHYFLYASCPEQVLCMVLLRSAEKTMSRALPLLAYIADTRTLTYYQYVWGNWFGWSMAGWHGHK